MTIDTGRLSDLQLIDLDGSIEDQTTIKRLSRIIELMKISMDFDSAREIADSTISSDEEVFAYIVELNAKILNLENPLNLTAL